MTVKELADELGVSKPTIAKAITDLGIEPRKVSNRFDLSDEDCDIIRAQILQSGNSPKAEKLQEAQSKEPQETQSKTEKSLISLLGTQISVLQEQLSVKDAQLAEKDKQLADLTSALKSSQEQHKALTDALTAAQALHAGTIQERLAAQADSSGGQSEVMTAETVSDLDEGEPAREPQQERRGFFARIFGRKDRGK